MQFFFLSFSLNLQGSPSMQFLFSFSLKLQSSPQSGWDFLYAVLLLVVFAITPKFTPYTFPLLFFAKTPKFTQKWVRFSLYGSWLSHKLQGSNGSGWGFRCAVLPLIFSRTPRFKRKWVGFYVCISSSCFRQNSKVHQELGEILLKLQGSPRPRCDFAKTLRFTDTELGESLRVRSFFLPVHEHTCVSVLVPHNPHNCTATASAVFPVSSVSHSVLWWHHVL